MNRFAVTFHLVGEDAPRDLIAFASHEGSAGWRVWGVKDPARGELVLITASERAQLEAIVAEQASAQASLFAGRSS